MRADQTSERSTMRERYRADLEHRERLLGKTAERRARLRARAEALARIRAARAPQRPPAPILRADGWPITNANAWCRGGLYNDADVTAVMPSPTPGTLWSRVSST